MFGCCSLSCSEPGDIVIVGLLCFKKDNAYYAPREDVSRNMHSIHLARSHARKHDGYADTLCEMTRLFFICLIKTDWKERDFEAGLKLNDERANESIFRIVLSISGQQVCFDFFVLN